MAHYSRFGCLPRHVSEAPGLLIDGDLDASSPQRCRGRKSAHSWRADDCYGKSFHVGMPRFPKGNENSRNVLSRLFRFG